MLNIKKLKEMKKIILFCFGICVSISIQAQTASDYKADAEEAQQYNLEKWTLLEDTPLFSLIKDYYYAVKTIDKDGITEYGIKFRHEKRDEDSESFIDWFANLLDKNFWYIYQSFKNTYDTELKRKVFANTEEYISLNNDLTSFSDRAKTNTYYYLHDGISSYDLKSKSFYCYLVRIKPYEPEYLYFHGLCLSYPSKYTTYGSTDYYLYQREFQKFQLPVLDENIALEIENNIKDCAVLFIFNIEKTKHITREQGRTIGDLLGNGFDRADWYILGKTKSVYIVNIENGRVYLQVPL
jgi:hypothetical protein